MEADATPDLALACGRAWPWIRFGVHFPMALRCVSSKESKSRDRPDTARRSERRWSLQARDRRQSRLSGVSCRGTPHIVSGSNSRGVREFRTARGAGLASGGAALTGRAASAPSSCAIDTWLGKDSLSSASFGDLTSFESLSFDFDSAFRIATSSSISCMSNRVGGNPRRLRTGRGASTSIAGVFGPPESDSSSLESQSAHCQSLYFPFLGTRFKGGSWHL